MSNGGRIFLVGSIIVTGITVLGVNYYIDEEKKRKRANIYGDISRRKEQRRLNMEEYQKQLQIEEKLRLAEK